jgi:hypothetical protein
MAVFTPQAVTVIDAFNRADGAINAGAGASVWDSIDVLGAAMDWIITGNQAAPNNAGKGVMSIGTLPSDFEASWEVPVTDDTSDYLVWYFDRQDANNFYYLILAPGAGWKLRKRIAGTYSDVLVVSTDLPAYAALEEIDVYRVADVARVRYRIDGAWVDTPLLEASCPALGASGKYGFEASGAWHIDNFKGNAAIEEAGGGGGGGGDPTTGTIIYVQADIGDDSRSRATASDSATPVATAQRAAMIAWAGSDDSENPGQPWGDIIRILPAEVADAANKDPRMYAPIHHLWTGGDVIPFGDNTGNGKIWVEAVQVDPVDATKWSGVPLSTPLMGKLKNWGVRSADPETHGSFQFGYDVGSGDDNLTIGSLTLVAELEFDDVLFTGGGYDIRGWSDVLFKRCYARSPLSLFAGSGNRFLDGAGFHLSYVDNGTGTEFVGNVRWTECVFDTINGEDALQLYGGSPDVAYTGSFVEIDHNLFVNILGQAGFHTDSIQVLGGMDFYVHDNSFFGCDDVLLATDGHNKTIRFENNLMSGCGLPVQIQGTDEIIYRHNTSAGSFFRTTMIVFDRFSLPAPPKITMVNNVLEDYDIQVTIDAASILAPNVVLYRPGADGNLTGFAEFGTSARMSDLPTSTTARPSLPANYELSNTPLLSVGIGDGVVLSGANGGALTHDRLGRAYSNPPDVGCHQSSVGTPVSPANRPPYLVTRAPTSGALDVALDTTFVQTWYPMPGEAMDPATINTTTVFVTDPRGVHIPLAGVVLTGPDGDGVYTVTASLERRLLRYVEYTINLASEIADTNGNEFGVDLAWAFTALGYYPEPGVDQSDILNPWEGYNNAAYSRALDVLELAQES